MGIALLGWRAWGRGHVDACLLLFVLFLGAMQGWQGQAHADAGTTPADRASTFVTIAVAPRLQLIEDEVGAADRQVAAYQAGAVASPELAATLQSAARVISAVGPSLGTVPLPPLDPALTVPLQCMDEDLVTFSDQLTVLLQDTAAAAARLLPVDVTYGVGYRPRVRSLLRVLRRAEGWLQAVDRATGAHMRLPGFEPGPPLEQRLDLP
jgi:hypothetical protein